MKNNALRGALLTATAIAGLALSQPAMAQTDAQLQSIEQQIKALQTELARVKANLARRDEALRAAQAQAKAAQDQAAAAQTQAAATAAQVASVPPPPPPAPPLPNGTFRVGGVTVTLGGFAAAEGVYRTRNQGASIDTNFNSGIPLPNSPNYNQGELRETAQQSRFSILAQGKPDDATTLTSYMETDFLSAGTSSNSNQSSSYTLRLRQFWADYDNSNLGLYVLGGQDWSLATMYRVGLVPRQENVPLTIDAQYVVGFDWARQAQFRVVKDFYDQKLWAGLSVENPQTIYSGSAGPNCLTGAAASAASGGGTLEYTTCGGSNVNTVQAYSNNVAPDVIAKLAADPGFGHYEVYGLLRFFDGHVDNATTGASTGYSATGEGVGAGMILPLVPKKLEFQVSGLIGQGVGRYGSAQLPDVTFNTTGKIEPIPEYSVMGGFVGHPVPSVDIYAYGGAEEADRKYYTSGKIDAGYGNPNVSLAGCDVVLGSCSASTSGVVEGTIGAWWRFLKANYGTMQVGAEYEYLDRSTFSGVGATKGSVIAPSANENVFLLSFRYLPFQ